MFPRFRIPIGVEYNQLSHAVVILFHVLSDNHETCYVAEPIGRSGYPIHKPDVQMLCVYPLEQIRANETFYLDERDFSQSLMVIVVVFVGLEVRFVRIRE